MILIIHINSNFEQALCTLYMFFLQHYPVAMMHVTKRRYQFQSLIDFSGKYIYRDSHEDNEYNRICSEEMDLTIRQHITKEIVISLSFAFASIGPVYAYFRYGILTTIVDAHIPFLEPKSKAEFLGNCSLLIILSTHTFVAYVGLEIVLTLLENSVAIVPRLIEMNIKDTIELYEKKLLTKPQLNATFRNIVKLSMDSDA